MPLSYRNAILHRHTTKESYNNDKVKSDRDQRRPNRVHYHFPIIDVLIYANSHFHLVCNIGKVTDTE